MTLEASSNGAKQLISNGHLKWIEISGALDKAGKVEKFIESAQIGIANE